MKLYIITLKTSDVPRWFFDPKEMAAFVDANENSEMDLIILNIPDLVIKKHLNEEGK